jgi:hypothetical protein
MKKETKRAVRRGHIARLKEKRIREKYWGRCLHNGTEWTSKSLGVCINTPQVCSCLSCGNQRKWNGESISEKRNRDNFNQQLELL